MRKIRFGRTNVEVPAVSLGTWGHGGPNIARGDVSVGWSGHDDRLAREALVASYRAGITHWDTADVYGNGNAEKLIGESWDEVPRDEIFIATKVGWDHGSYPHVYHPTLIRERMDRSLRLMKTDHVELYYLHHCDFGPADEYFDDAVATLQKFRDEGKARFLGLSDWSSEKLLKFARRMNPDAVQPYRSVLDDQYLSSGLAEWVNANDAGVAFFSPLKHGLLLGKYQEPVEFPEGDFRKNIPGFADPAVIEQMKRNRRLMEERYHHQAEPVMHAVVGAILADSPTGTVLLGQRNRKQVESAATIGEALPLDEAAEVRALYGGPGAGGRGPE